jgi:hypothetical protein
MTIGEIIFVGATYYAVLVTGIVVAALCIAGRRN